MTCKDCIHERVCFALIKDGLPYMDDEHPAEAFCMTFKNKLDVCELTYGKWISASNKPGVDIGMKCSICGARIKNSEHLNGNHRFCHKCGARMINGGN